MMNWPDYVLLSGVAFVVFGLLRALYHGFAQDQDEDLMLQIITDLAWCLIGLVVAAISIVLKLLMGVFVI